MFNNAFFPLMLLKNKRFLILVGCLFFLLSISLFLFDPLFEALDEIFNFKLSKAPIAISLLFSSIFSLSLIYLQSGEKESSEKYDSYYMKILLKEYESQKHLIRVTVEKVSELTDKIKEYEVNKDLSEEKELIIAGAIEQTSEEAIKAIFENEANNLRSSIKDSLCVDRLTKLSESITHRLRREIDDLRLRSNVNLLIGMTITGGGLYLLWTTVSIVDSSELLKQLASEGVESNYKFIKNMTLPIIPRILLVIFVEIFAYFFLRLYKNGLSEIKYFQNELTNVESKLAAVEFSYMTNNSDGLKSSIESLSKTERNFILEKGQTTVELEIAKSESELARNMIKKIPYFFKSRSK